MKAILKIRFLQALIGILFGCMMYFGVEMDAKAIELRLSHHLPPTAIPAKALEQWAKRLETETNGGVKITIFPSESLAKGRDAYSATAAGVCDIAWVPAMYESSRWSLNCIVNLVALPITTDKRGIEIWDKLREKYPVMLKELEGVKDLFHTISLPTSLHTKKAVRVPDDIKRMKIAGLGDIVKILQAAGASPVSMPASDLYMSLEKGVIEGAMVPINVLTDRGAEVEVRYHVDLGIGQGGNIMIINLNRWNSFPPDIKTKFEGLNSWGNELLMKALEQVMMEGWQKCQGHTIVKPTPEELKLWLACAQQAADDWIKTNENKGPTREMFEYAKKLIAETK